MGSLPGVEAGELDIGGGQAQSAEEERGGFLVDMAGQDKADDFSEDYLNGVGVFEGRKVEGGFYGFVGIELAGAAAVLVVEETMAFGTQGGRSALDAVGLDVLAAGDGAGSGSAGCFGSCGHFVLLRNSSRFSVLSEFLVGAIEKGAEMESAPFLYY
jgi:hypothetical protein